MSKASTMAALIKLAPVPLHVDMTWRIRDLYADEKNVRQLIAWRERRARLRAAVDQYTRILIERHGF